MRVTRTARAGHAYLACNESGIIVADVTVSPPALVTQVGLGAGTGTGTGKIVLRR
jgi:hypothetical protein